MTALLLDTHILVWAVNAEQKLGRKARALIEQHWSAGDVAVSALSFWEIGLLQARGRLQLPAPVGVWRSQLLAAGLAEWPLTGEIAVRALDLASLPDDPADRFIAATALVLVLVHGAALMTADEKLLDWHHALERHDGKT